MKSSKTPAKRRPIEREYLATLNAAVPLTVWRKICRRTVDDALAGDAKAREWLSKWLLPADSRQLTVMAAEEAQADATTAAQLEIDETAAKLDEDRTLAGICQMASVR